MQAYTCEQHLVCWGQGRGQHGNCFLGTTACVAKHSRHIRTAPLPHSCRHPFAHTGRYLVRLQNFTAWYVVLVLHSPVVLCRQTAWGHDEVNAMSRSPRAWFNLGLTIVDSLDTLMIAGLKEEYQEARHWVANHLQFRDGSSVQFFEVNIRILGGLLSAYYLSEGDDMYLHKAQMLADR